MIANVLVETKSIDKTFSYSIPSHMIAKAKIGMRVLIPFGSRQVEGFIVDIDNQPVDYDVKELISFVDLEPVLNPELLKLGEYMSKKTLCTLTQAYQTMLPKALRAKKNVSISKKMLSYLKIVRNYVPKNEKEKDFFDLWNGKTLLLRKEATSYSSYLVKKFIDMGVLDVVEKEVYRLEDNAIIIEENIQLTLEQQQVIHHISFGSFMPYLLHGVTGSGKTEVYKQLIQKVILEGKEALVLVPEISLTPQLVSSFKKRFGKTIAIIHSRLSDGEKYDEWRKIERKEVSIVIGARSAVFAPFTNLGIIIIDEEHSTTYKQENVPRYHAIDMALFRAKYHRCPIVLGSATPSIESYTRAKLGTYTLLEMKNRVHQEMPNVYLVDMKEEMKQKHFVFSSLLEEKIEDRLTKGEQTIILLNRRGYTTISTCNSCGFVHKCPKCDIPLTYHLKKHKMLCHYCNYETKKLIACPVCHSQDLNERGMGTEKLEQLVLQRFGNARVIRMDVDTTRTKSAHEKIISAFEQHQFDILIGTQMIAKGLDFKEVTLVGVVNGDASLAIPDFRSGERTFQLLNQVSGRSGRSDKAGEVIIQAFNVDHYSLVYASTNDYLSFYKEEMNIRKTLKYPPFYNLALIKIQGLDSASCEEEGNKIVAYLNENSKDTLILGPSLAMIPKINNVYFYQIIVKYKDTQAIIEQFQFIVKKYRNHKLKVGIDFNPNRI